MPKPVYMLCCQSGSDDERTKLASHFNVYDRVEIIVTPGKPGSDGPAVIYTMPLRIVAVWSADKKEDFDTTFDVQVRLLAPQLREPRTIHDGKFRFEQGTPKQKFTFDIQGFFVSGEGDLVAECRIRRSGELRWLKQSYTIDVVIVPGPEAEEPPDDSTLRPRKRK